MIDFSQVDFAKQWPGVWERDQLLEIDGLTLFQKILVGDAPMAPIADLMDFYLAEVEKGRIVYASKPSKKIYNPLGTAHGGYAATMLDSAMGCAVHTMLPAGKSYTTAELSINYIRPMFETTSEVHAIGTVLHSGRTVATAEGKILDANDKLIAHGTTTCVVFDL